MALTEKERLSLENVLEQIVLAEKAAEALRFSYERCPEISHEKDLGVFHYKRNSDTSFLEKAIAGL